uniref:Uncharacterized protein n=1 Tax=Arundo donax TaxID=35708 RepID=A0A0A9BZB5_ARUDO
MVRCHSFSICYLHQHRVSWLGLDTCSL